MSSPSSYEYCRGAAAVSACRRARQGTLQHTPGSRACRPAHRQSSRPPSTSYRASFPSRVLQRRAHERRAFAGLHVEAIFHTDPSSSIVAVLEVRGRAHGHRGATARVRGQPRLRRHERREQHRAPTCTTATRSGRCSRRVQPESQQEQSRRRVPSGNGQNGFTSTRAPGRRSGRARAQLPAAGRRCARSRPPAPGTRAGRRRPALDARGGGPHCGGGVARSQKSQTASRLSATRRRQRRRPARCSGGRRREEAAPRRAAAGAPRAGGAGAEGVQRAHTKHPAAAPATAAVRWRRRQRSCGRVRGRGRGSGGGPRVWGWRHRGGSGAAWRRSASSGPSASRSVGRRGRCRAGGPV